MLVQLSVKDVQDYWKLINHALHQSVPPIGIETPAFFTNIQGMLLNGRMQAWCCIIDDQFLGLCITMIQHEPFNEFNTLLIFAVYGYYELPSEVWAEGLATLRAYAKACQCRKIVAYTIHKGIAEIVRSLGGTSQYLVEYDVEVQNG